MRSVDKVIVIVFDTILPEAILKPSGKFVDFILSFAKRIAILATVLFAFSCLKKSVASGENALGLYASL